MSRIFECKECGYQTPKWMGRCTSCGNWDTLEEKDDETKSSKRSRKSPVKIYNLGKDIKQTKKTRVKTGFAEMDRVLGGGMVEGEVLLIGGAPGIGKTTLLLQMIHRLNDKKIDGLYISGEESLEQISVHSKRLNLKKDMDFISSNDVDEIISTLSKNKYSCVVVDSIQTIKTDDNKGIQGGTSQVKECATRLIDYAKEKNVTIFLVGHITKDGDVAGPKILEHLVDAVLYLEGDSAGNYRILRSIKNRFGSTQDLGIFNFKSNGFSDADNPAEMFVISKDSLIGVCKGVIYEGGRTLVVEVQALTSDSNFTMPQRIVDGVKKTKVQMLIALLSKYTDVDLSELDVYVNIASGLKVNDSSMDLAISAAILSSFYQKKIKSNILAIGEVSLTGQVYRGNYLKEKLSSVRRLGYTDLLISDKINKKLKDTNNFVFINSVADLKEKIF